MSRWQAVFRHGRALSTRPTNKRADQESFGSWGAAVGGVSAVALGYKVYSERDRYLVHAKGGDVTAEQKSFDNRTRQYNSPDMVFNYFASMQLLEKSGWSSKMS